jgi:hypothetical protein
MLRIYSDRIDYYPAEQGIRVLRLGRLTLQLGARRGHWIPCHVAWAAGPSGTRSAHSRATLVTPKNCRILAWCTTECASCPDRLRAS